MARVTVEDCIEQVPNRFKLVVMAVQRAKELSAGAMPTLERNNDKNPVVALREIAEKTVKIDDLEQSFVRSLQKNAPVDENEEDLESILAQDHAVLDMAAENEEIESADGFSISDAEAVADEDAA